MVSAPLLPEEGQFVTEQQRRTKQKEPVKPFLRFASLMRYNMLLGLWQQPLFHPVFFRGEGPRLGWLEIMVIALLDGS